MNYKQRMITITYTERDEKELKRISERVKKERYVKWDREEVLIKERDKEIIVNRD